MRKIFYMLILCLSCSFAWANEVDTAIKNLSKEIIASYQKLPGAKRIKNVAVLDFKNKSMLAVRNNLGVAFSEMLTQHLVRYRNDLRIIERKDLGAILRENELKMTGIAGSADASAYGEILGADLIILGSVLESGGMVRVTVRVVETGKSQVLLSERVDIDKNAFVDKARRFVKVTHSISVGYMYQFIDDFRVNSGYVMYTYNFYYGLALGFQMFAGVSDSKNYEQRDEYANGVTIYTSRYEKKFQQAGLNILFSKTLNLFGGLRLTPFAGPSLLYFADKSKMTYFDLNGLSYGIKPSVLYPSYFLFGLKTGVRLEYQFTPSYQIFIGGEYQYFPDVQIIKSFGWEKKDGTVDSSVPVVFTWYDKAKLSGFSIMAGATCSF